jgi:hypothetical protein
MTHQALLMTDFGRVKIPVAKHLGKKFRSAFLVNELDTIFFYLIMNSEFPPITSVEQRRRYKTEFDKDYAEYRQLHLIMDKARRRFAGLQQELKNTSPSERKYKV